MSRWRFTAILIFFLPCMGCLILPTPRHAWRGIFPTRGGIARSDLAAIAPGIATREEVLLCLGEPDVIKDQGRIIAYHWVLIHGYLIISGYLTSEAFPITFSHYYFIEFDAQGIVRRTELMQNSGFVLDSLYAWPELPHSFWFDLVHHRASR